MPGVQREIPQDDGESGMTVRVSKNILIQCNYCGAYHDLPMTKPKAQMIAEFREKGWSFGRNGKKALCSVCNGRYFKENGSK